MNSENTKTSHPLRLLIKFTYKIDLQRGENTYGKTKSFYKNI